MTQQCEPTEEDLTPSAESRAITRGIDLRHEIKRAGELGVLAFPTAKRWADELTAIIALFGEVE